MSPLWKPSRDGFVESQDGRWRIVPLWWGRVSPVEYILKREGQRISTHSTQRDAKAEAERLEAPLARSLPRLTAAQQRVYDELKASGVKVYNGRMGKTLHALRDLGLVVFDYDVMIHALGGSTERYTVKLANEPSPRSRNARAT